MADEEHLKLLQQGIAQWNQWRKENPLIHPNLDLTDLRERDFREADLSNVSFRGAVLAGTNFTNADLRGADFRGATLIRTDFTLALLKGADFRGAMLNKAWFTDLSGVDLSNAGLHEAHLRQACLRNANLNHALLSNADLSKADLREANMSGAFLIGANLSNAILSSADLSHTNLENADLRMAHLDNANLRGVNLRGANLSNANLRGANLRDANLSWVSLSEANLSEADLTGCSVYAISAWNVRLERAKQDNLIITPFHESAITVDDLEVAQLVYLLLNHKKLRNVLNAVTKRGVLLLGRFGGGGLEVLQAVAAKLREEEYLPIIFDFGRPDDRNLTETVKTLAGLSRFIIADLSGPSIPLELYATVPHFKIPFVPILEAGRKQFAMAVDLLEYPWVIRPPVIFASTDELVSLVSSKIIAPAEEKHQLRQQLLNELFNPL